MLSSHLAVNLATAGYRTLLIDADLRRPAVHKVFHLANDPGLCEVLRGRCRGCRRAQARAGRRLVAPSCRGL